MLRFRKTSEKERSSRSSSRMRSQSSSESASYSLGRKGGWCHTHSRLSCTASRNSCVR